MKTEIDAEGAAYIEYRKEHTRLVELEHSEAERCDRLVITLSSGALALTVTFLKDIAPSIQENSKFLILASWIFFLASLISTTYSYFLSQAAFRFYRDDVLQTDCTTDDSLMPKYEKQIRNIVLCNYTSFLSLIFGSVTLVIFAYMNIETESMKNKSGNVSKQERKISMTDDKVNGGYVPQKPAKPPTSEKKTPPPPTPKNNNK
ncbi:MAG: hypothetical protein NXI29_00535 [bacterium]|nr:hypothetical protein [bacterium]